MGYSASYVGTSWFKGSNILISNGYEPVTAIKTDGVERMIFKNIKNDDLMNFLTITGGLRSVLLSAKREENNANL